MKFLKLFLLFAVFAFASSVNAQTDCEACAGDLDKALTTSLPAGFTFVSATWSPQGGTGLTADVTTPGTYTNTVVALDPSGCEVTADYVYTVTENPLPECAPTNDGPVCDGEDVTLTANPTGGTGAYTFSWTGPGGFASSDENPVVSPAVAGTYELMVTDSKGCTNTCTTEVVITTPAVLNLTGVCEDN